MKYVNKDRYFTKSHLARTLFMWNGENRGKFCTTGGRLIVVKYVNKDRYFTNPISHVRCFCEMVETEDNFAQGVEGRF